MTKETKERDAFEIVVHLEDGRASNSFHAATNGRQRADRLARDAKRPGIWIKRREREREGEIRVGARTRYKGISLSLVSSFYQLPRRDQSRRKDNAISLCCMNISLYS